MLSAWGVCLHASCKGWCLENADMELTIMLLPIKLARERTEEVQRRQGFCPWAEEISFLISLISFSWWWLATLWNINPPLYNLPSLHPTIWQSLSLSLSLLLLSLPQWNNDAVQTNDNVPLWILQREGGKCFPLDNYSSFKPQTRQIHTDWDDQSALCSFTAVCRPHAITVLYFLINS